MNFILFLPDEMSAPAVSCYGNRTVEMPFYERLASEGTLFENCIVQNPVCSPSRCALMTGLYPHCAGHRTLWHLLRPHEPNLLSALQQAGYEIAWFGKNDLCSRQVMHALTGRGSCNEKGPDYKGGENAFKSGEPGYYSFLNRPLPPGEDDIDPNIRAAVRFLSQPHERPFFLFLPISMPHPPYSAPERWYNRYDPAKASQELILPGAGEGRPGYEALIRRYRGLDQVPQSLLQKIHAVYLGMNSYVDELLGLIEQALSRFGLREKTTLIATSDHGDWHGSRGLVEKWPNAMDDEIVRVPLIIRTPGGEKGARRTGPVAQMDVMATVLELAGVSAQHSHFSESLVPQLFGGSGEADRAVFCEGGYDIREPHCFEGYIGRSDPLMRPESIYYPKLRQQQEHPESVCRSVMLRTLDWKLIRRTSGEHELYHLKEDPQELKNLYGLPEAAETSRLLETRLLDWYLSTSDTTPFQEDGR